METQNSKEVENGKTTWNLKWDMIKIQEPNGLDGPTDEKNRQQILGALNQGFEPFAVTTIPTRKSMLSNEVVASNWLYFKRPSTTDELIDQSEKILR